MVDFADFTQIEFINSLASSDPTPGGGSAAAIALSQSAGLTVMVGTAYAFMTSRDLVTTGRTFNTFSAKVFLLRFYNI